MTLTIHGLPIEFFLHHLLPILDYDDLLALTCTNKAFANLCSDDMLWRRKLKSDLNFAIVDARDKGFKFLYRGIRRPHVYVWGSYDNGRLGIKDPHRVYSQPSNGGRGIPFPVELSMPSMRTVAIVAGGWSFATLDDEGLLHVWGQLDAEGVQWYSRLPTLGNSSHQQSVPVTLKLPNPVTAVTAGRRHLLALDSEQGVWLFNSWGRPALLTTPQLPSPSPSPSSYSSSRTEASEAAQIAQIECGWDTIAILLSSGTVLIDWPFHGGLGEKVHQHHVDQAQNPDGTSAVVPANSDNTLRCATWELDHVLLELPPIPADLPIINHGALKYHANPAVSNGGDTSAVKLVKIAAGLDFVIGLTNHGHVLKINLPSGRQRVVIFEDWTYLPEYSELGKVQASFSRKRVSPPESLFVSHISAAFKTFAVYSTATSSSSIVLLGRSDTTAAPHRASSKPTIIPKLQHQNVISVVLGDYHFIALTEDGVLLSWGSYSDGALGLGNAGQRSNVEEPSEVRFDRIGGIEDSFVFGVAAAGWHSAALVINMSPATPASD